MKNRRSSFMLLALGLLLLICLTACVACTSNEQRVTRVSEDTFQINLSSRRFRMLRIRNRVVDPERYTVSGENGVTLITLHADILEQYVGHKVAVSFNFNNGFARAKLDLRDYKPMAAEEQAMEPPLDVFAAEEPAAEEPVTDVSVAEEPVVEEPVVEELAVEEPAAEEPTVEQASSKRVFVVERTGLLGEFYGRYYDDPEGFEIDFVPTREEADPNAGDTIVTVPGTRAIAAAFADCGSVGEIAERAQNYAGQLAGVRLDVNGIFSHAKEYVAEKLPGIGMEDVKAYVRSLLTPEAEKSAAGEPVAEEPVAEEPAAEESVSEEPAAEDPATEVHAAGEPVAEEPVAEELLTEEPPTEEPGTVSASQNGICYIVEPSGLLKGFIERYYPIPEGMDIVFVQDPSGIDLLPGSMVLTVDLDHLSENARAYMMDRLRRIASEKVAAEESEEAAVPEESGEAAVVEEEPAPQEEQPVSVYHIVEKSGMLEEFFNRYYSVPKGYALDFVRDRSDAILSKGEFVVTVPGREMLSAFFAGCADIADMEERTQGFAESYAGFRLDLKRIEAHAAEYLGERFPGEQDSAELVLRWLGLVQEEPSAAEETEAAPEPVIHAAICIVEKTGELEKVFYLRYTVPEGMTVRFADDPEDAQEGEIVVVIDLAGMDREARDYLLEVFFGIEPAEEEPEAPSEEVGKEAVQTEETVAAEPAEERPVMYYVLEKSRVLGDFFRRYYSAPSGTQIEFVPDRDSFLPAPGDHIVTVPGMQVILSAFEGCSGLADAAERVQELAERRIGSRLDLAGLMGHVEEYLSEILPGITRADLERFILETLGIAAGETEEEPAPESEQGELPAPEETAEEPVPPILYVEEKTGLLRDFFTAFYASEGREVRFVTDAAECELRPEDILIRVEIQDLLADGKGYLEQLFPGITIYLLGAEEEGSEEPAEEELVEEIITVPEEALQTYHFVEPTGILGDFFNRYYTAPEGTEFRFVRSREELSTEYGDYIVTVPWPDGICAAYAGCESLADIAGRTQEYALRYVGSTLDLNGIAAHMQEYALEKAPSLMNDGLEDLLMDILGLKKAEPAAEEEIPVEVVPEEPALEETEVEPEPRTYFIVERSGILEDFIRTYYTLPEGMRIVFVTDPEEAAMKEGDMLLEIDVGDLSRQATEYSLELLLGAAA